MGVTPVTPNENDNTPNESDREIQLDTRQDLMPEINKPVNAQNVSVMSIGKSLMSSSYTSKKIMSVYNSSGHNIFDEDDKPYDENCDLFDQLNEYSEADEFKD